MIEPKSKGLFDAVTDNFQHTLIINRTDILKQFRLIDCSELL